MTMKPYNMHGIVARLLSHARKALGKDYSLPLLARIEAVQYLRKNKVLPIFGGIIVFLEKNGKGVFYTHMQGRVGEPEIPWNHALLLIKANYYLNGVAPKRKNL